MRGIILKDSIEQFGFKDGFSFWFRWSFKDPVETFIWLNITHKPYCLYSGWYCKDKNCSHKHLTKKKEILNNWKEMKKESEIIICGPNGECASCGEEPGTELIENPNWDTLEQWKVCKTCKEFIGLQRDITLLSILPKSKSEDKNKEIQDNIFNLNNRLLEIKKQTGKKISTIGIEKENNEYRITEV
jgi:hypothetical protein